MVIRFFNWIKQAYALLGKDVRVEFRTKYALNSFLMFALTTLVLVSFAVGPYILDEILHSALIWIIIFFSAMAGLARSFVSEQEKGTVYALKLSAIPETVYFGKFIYNFVLLFFVMIIVIPSYIFFLSPPVGNPGLLILVLLLGGLGLAATTTILAAMVSQANVKGNLLPVLAFPVLLPLLISAINGTRLALEGFPLGEARAELQILFSFFMIMITVSLMLFSFVWED
ncbi:heme exporter protein CcmB [Candidatus Contubernalis alkaliaceticus]|uniref:heme exporter protein CcmB n=1 Tax=Candidatus Contubernalis alkaliaceticus TaxID=338645 RepID=UPI001F4C2314|nr:heme exporter protein CcmB [Candidatus Contubernalis alkalaceticus]UNC92957.1 heme exporter protein CcmB [Candidatus Contubernalis alkalaceticus]